MKKYRKAKSKYIAVCSLTLWLYQPVNAQIEITTLPDSVITVGYARGTLKNISGSVEQITEQQMNKESAGSYSGTSTRIDYHEKQ